MNLERDDTTLRLERFDARTSFATATGQGDLDRGLVLAATLDLAVFAEQCRDWIDLGGVELAGQATLSANYRRQGDRFQVDADAAVDNLLLGGLPLVEKIQRDRFTGKGQLRGRAAPSGLPSAFTDLTLQARTGQTDLQLQAQTDAASGDISVDGRVKVPVVLSGRAQRLEAELSGRSRGRRVGGRADRAGSGARLEMGPWRRPRRGHPLGGHAAL